MRPCWALDLRISQLDVPAEILTTRASFLPYNPKLAYAAADISANVTALELWASYLITYGVSAPGCSTGTLGPFGGGLGMSWWWARADVVPTVMAAISNTAKHVKNFGVVLIRISPIMNQISKIGRPALPSRQSSRVKFGNTVCPGRTIVPVVGASSTCGSPTNN